MNPWAVRRKTLIFLLIFFVLVLTIGVPAYFFATREEASCSNNKQDGDETGIDCGGGCELICKPEVLPLLTKGSARVLQIATSTYEVAILLENPNINGRVVRAPYTFTIYSGSDKTPVKIMKGDTYIGRSSTFAIFGGPFTASSTAPLRAVFTWDGDLKWENSSDPLPNISVTNVNFTNSSTSAPRLEAQLTNRSQNNARNIEAIVLLSDQNGNVVGTGRTFVDLLESGASTPIVFTWTSPFPVEPVSKRIVPHILPDKSYLH
ncbi:hypothetical protein KW796_03220 [Candidatus Parcubacteria bacterium]|nr:hypothetical protein [Candidatus Parcubacteria bacterium]